MHREDAERMVFIRQVRAPAPALVFHTAHQNHAKVDGLFGGQATTKDMVSVGTQTPSPPFNCRMPPHFMINQFERNYNRLISSLKSRGQSHHRKKATGSHLTQERREPDQVESSFRYQQSSTPVFAMASQSAFRPVCPDVANVHGRHVSTAMVTAVPLSTNPPQHNSPAVTKPHREESGKYKCAGCGGHAKFLCSICRNVWYCSETCQVRTVFRVFHVFFQGDWFALCTAFCVPLYCC